MARKRLADEGASAFDGCIGGAKDVQGRTNTYKAHETQEEHEAYERLNLRIPKRIKDYLYEASWRESTATRRVSVTAYLIELVEKDMQEHEGE